MEPFAVSAVRALLVTLGVVWIGLSASAIVLAIGWLFGNFDVDRLLAVVGTCATVIGLLVTISVPLGKLLLRRNPKD